MTDLLVHPEIAGVLPSLLKYPPLKPKDWAGLSPGDRLYFLRENQLLMLGTVDDMAPDGSIFWIWIDGAGGRIALHKDDDVRVWLAEEPASSRIKNVSTGINSRHRDGAYPSPPVPSLEPNKETLCTSSQ